MILSIDVGGTNIKYACLNDDATLNQDCKVESVDTTPVPENEVDYESAYIKYLNQLSEIYNNYKSRYPINGIAISHPGIMENGFIKFGGGLIYTSGHHLANDLSKRCDDLPVTILNDAKCAAMAEYISGSLRDCETCACLTFGTAVGGGIIVNGKILENESGEISFLSRSTEISADDELHDYFGIYGSASMFIDSLIKQLDLPSDTTGHELFAVYAKDKKYQALIQSELDKFAFSIARVIFNMNLILKLEKVAIGGGISNQQIFINAIKDKMVDLSNRIIFKMMKYPTSIPEIVQCDYKSEANLVGAVSFYNQSKENNITKLT